MHLHLPTTPNKKTPVVQEDTPRRSARVRKEPDRYTDRPKVSHMEVVGRVDSFGSGGGKRRWSRRHRRRYQRRSKDEPERINLIAGSSVIVGRDVGVIPNSSRSRVRGDVDYVCRTPLW